MDDIWDDDAEQVTRPNTTRGFSSRSRMLSDSEEDRPSKRARTSNKPLFNPGSDDEAEKEAELPPDVGALFEGLDDDDYALEQLPAQLDTDQLRREADKRVAVEAAKKRMMRGDVLGDLADGAPGEKGKEKEPKAKKVIPKLDEQRLLDRDGLPALIRRTKDFNIKGKGHELGDLNRLMQTYQLWAHKMFPKMQFQDTVERVERLCRTKRMHVALSTWRDIDRAPGIPDVDIDDEAENQEQTDRNRAEAHPPTSSPARITLEPGGPPVRQSQADRDPDEDEDAMWRDMMDAMEMQQLEKEKQNQASGGRKESNDLGDDEEDWAAMDEMEQAVNSIKPSHDVGSKSVHPDVPSSPPGTDHDVSSDAPPELGPSEDEEDFYSMYEP